MPVLSVCVSESVGTGFADLRVSEQPKVEAGQNGMPQLGVLLINMLTEAMAHQHSYCKQAA